MIIPAPKVLVPDQPDMEGQIAAIPNGPGVYCLRIPGGEPHVAWSANLPKRLRRWLSVPPDSKLGDAKTRLLARVSAVECWTTRSKLESLLLLYELLKQLFPADYLRRLRLRMPWFLTTVAEDQFARLAITNRIIPTAPLTIGPFATRELAQHYQEEVLGLFQIRRCTEPLQPSPVHPGCVFGEMNCCLRPCQLAVSRDEYAVEAERMSQFLVTNGKDELSSLASGREQASASLLFEDAAVLHKRIERVQAAIAAREEVVRDVDQLSGIALTPSTQAQRVLLWPLWRGAWQEAIPFDVSGENVEFSRLRGELREKLASVAGQAVLRKTQDRLEHISLFLRWYRSSSRDGEWFPFSPTADLNYRKLVRGIRQLAKAGSMHTVT